MNEDLKIALEKYKECTIRLINSLEQEDFNILENILKDRQEIINNIEKLEYSKEQFRKLVEELQILPFQNKLSDITNEKIIKSRNELDKISSSKAATKSYNNNFYKNTVIFSKKI